MAGGCQEARKVDGWLTGGKRQGPWGLLGLTGQWPAAGGAEPGRPPDGRQLWGLSLHSCRTRTRHWTHSLCSQGAPGECYSGLQAGSTKGHCVARVGTRRLGLPYLRQ